MHQIGIGNYIEYLTAQKLFGNSPARYFYYLSRNKKSKVQMGMGYGKRVSLTDQEARDKISLMASEMYQAQSIKDLDVSQRIQLATNAKSKWGIQSKQSARFLHLPHDALKGIID